MSLTQAEIIKIAEELCQVQAEGMVYPFEIDDAITLHPDYPSTFLAAGRTVVQMITALERAGFKVEKIT